LLKNIYTTQKMSRFIPFPTINSSPQRPINLKEIMSPEEYINTNPPTFHRYCVPSKTDAELTCTICNEPIEEEQDGEEKGVSLSCPCKLNYHKECIFGWFRKCTDPAEKYSNGKLSCIMCRQTPTPIQTNFDFQNNPDEYIESVTNQVPIKTNLFGSDE
jgi:hypothetical protein